MHDGLCCRDKCKKQNARQSKKEDKTKTKQKAKVKTRKTEKKKRNQHCLLVVTSEKIAIVFATWALAGLVLLGLTNQHLRA